MIKMMSFSLEFVKYIRIQSERDGKWKLISGISQFSRYCKALDGYNFQKCCSIHKSLQNLNRYILILFWKLLRPLNILTLFVQFVPVIDH